MELDLQIKKEFRERIMGKQEKCMDYEASWAALNGVVIAYLKANGEYSIDKEYKLKQAVRSVILSLPLYEIGYGQEYKLNREDKAYLSLCPNELVEGLCYRDIKEDKIVELAQKVIELSAEKGYREDGKMRIADRGVSKASMEEFDDMNNQMTQMYDIIRTSRGEEGLKVAMDYYRLLADKAVKDEIDYHIDNANYIVKFFANILHHAREGESEISA